MLKAKFGLMLLINYFTPFKIRLTYIYIFFHVINNLSPKDKRNNF